MQGNTLVFDSEDEMAVLMDYCLHDVRRQGVTVVERYLADSPPPADSDEMVLLQALRRARYALLVVESLEPGVGAQVRDLWRDEPFFLFDVGLSRSGRVGLTLACRVMEPEGIRMTTGTALPIGVLSPAERARYLAETKALFQAGELQNLSPERASELAKTVIRQSLRRGAARHIAYVEPGQQRQLGVGGRAPSAGRGVGRNDPCPCGSGKKFKRCCAPRR
jgi:hypothetical protein